MIIFDTISTLDGNLDSFLSVVRSHFWVDFFLVFTDLGKWQIIAGFSVGIIFALWFWKKRNYIIPFIIAVAGGQLFGSAVKRIVGRPRPPQGVYHEESFSFPSGHALVAVVFYGAILYYIWKNVKNEALRNALVFFGIVIILLIGFSRLYLGMHYLSDVIGGFLFGAAWLALGIIFLKKL